MDDNLSLTEAVKERYRGMYTGVFFKRYILGEWKSADGVIYRQFADDPERFILDEVRRISSSERWGLTSAETARRTRAVLWE